MIESLRLVLCSDGNRAYNLIHRACPFIFHTCVMLQNIMAVIRASFFAVIISLKDLLFVYVP